jgi:subtilisin family serine protease
VARALALALLALLAASLASAAPVRLINVAGRPYVQLGAHGERIVHPAQVVADRLILILDQTAPVSAQSVQALAQAVSGARVRAILPRSHLMIVDLPPGSDLTRAAARFTRQPGVRLAVPDLPVYPALVPNDPNYPLQYNLPLIRAPQAWNVTTGSASTIIAIVDSGVDTTHPDLAGKIWTNPNPGSDPDYPNDIHGWNFVENNNNVEPVPVAGQSNETVSHGTLVAGTAAAIGNDGYGCAGVDWLARIMPVKIFDNNGVGTDSNVVLAMDYAVAHGANVINLSLGGTWSAAYTPAIEAAYKAGVVVVCAAGNQYQALSNDSSTWLSPVCNDGPNPLTDNMILGVGGTDQYDRLAPWSNYDTSTGKHFVDLCAPGMSIYGPLFEEAGFPGFTAFWGSESGTSFSSPQVAGAAALLMAHNPSLTPAQIFALLKGSTDNIDALNPGYAGDTGGRLNIARALGVVNPPQAVGNLQAVNTPLSLGGSLTLTWLKSGDDGAGANNVTKYTVYRRQGTTGTWIDLKDLATGTVQYVDATTTDGLPYYYKVRTWAGTLYSDSAVVGPVQSSDDLPPPAVTTLQAADRPHDSGGAIVLNWTYTAPPHFQAFHLYRQPYPFTNVTGYTPLHVITTATTATWTDTTTVDLTDYYYAITAVDTFGNENKNVTAVGPVESFRNLPLSFPAGLALMATPVLPPDLDPATLLGLPAAGLQYAVYYTAQKKYLYYTGEPLPTALQLALGHGFWVKLTGTVTVTPTGQAAPSGNFPVNLVAGWQTLGNPFFGALDFSTCTVTYNGTIMDLNSAHTAGLFPGVAWIWDPSIKGYRMIDGTTSGGLPVAAWQGFWVQGLKLCALNLTRPGTSAAAASVETQAAAPGKGEWRLQLMAQAGPYLDPDNYVGVAAQARQVESPPLPGEGVELSLGAGPGGGPLAMNLQPLAAGPLTQPITVTWSGVSGSVRLAWPTINTLATDKTFLLTDLATGQVTNLRTAPSYLFPATHPSGQRQFTLTVSSQATTSLQVSALSAEVGGRGAAITFALSAPATCAVEILNIAGRSVRRLVTGQVCAAGVNTLRWDGRGQGGSPVPPGQYLVSLQARDGQGGQVRLLRGLVILAR